MKKIVFALVMSVIMIGLASCGGNKHSKAFKDSKKLLDEMMVTVEKAQSCEDLDTVVYYIGSLFTMGGIDKMSEPEKQEIADFMKQIGDVVGQKKAEFECLDPEESNDDVMPLDEPIEEEE